MLVPMYNKEHKLTGFMFFCPGCRENHTINIETQSGKLFWTYNNNTQYPTFRPSVLIKAGCKTSQYVPGTACWCNYEAKYGQPAPFRCLVCHFHITDGTIQYLSDSTHELSGKTIRIDEIEQ